MRSTRRNRRRHNYESVCQVAAFRSAPFCCFLPFCWSRPAAPRKPSRIYSHHPPTNSPSRGCSASMKLPDCSNYSIPLGPVIAKVRTLHAGALQLQTTFLGEFHVPGKSPPRGIKDVDADSPRENASMKNGPPGLVPSASPHSLWPRVPLGGPATLHEDLIPTPLIGKIATHLHPPSVSLRTNRRFAPGLFRFQTAPRSIHPLPANPGKVASWTFSPRTPHGTCPRRCTFGQQVHFPPRRFIPRTTAAAEIDVTTSIPLLASSSPDGRTILSASPRKS